MFGAAREIRTPDPLITNEVLYQLSYCGATMGQGANPEAYDAVYANFPGFGNIPLARRRRRAWDPPASWRKGGRSASPAGGDGRSGQWRDVWRASSRF